MLVTGLAKLSGQGESLLYEEIQKIGIPELMNALELREEKFNGISGWKAFVKLPREHHHRTFNDIKNILDLFND